MFGQSKDPVCGMKVSQDSHHKAEYQGKEYCFCCQECLDKFKKSPSQYKNK